MSANTEALIDFANALEAAVVKLKHELGAKPQDVKRAEKFRLEPL
jgi:hypothetical protein